VLYLCHIILLYSVSVIKSLNSFKRLGHGISTCNMDMNLKENFKKCNKLNGIIRTFLEKSKTKYGSASHSASYPVSVPGDLPMGLEVRLRMHGAVPPLLRLSSCHGA